MHIVQQRLPLSRLFPDAIVRSRETGRVLLAGLLLFTCLQTAASVRILGTCEQDIPVVAATLQLSEGGVRMLREAMRTGDAGKLQNLSQEMELRATGENGLTFEERMRPLMERFECASYPMSLVSLFVGFLSLLFCSIVVNARVRRLRLLPGVLQRLTIPMFHLGIASIVLTYAWVPMVGSVILVKVTGASAFVLLNILTFVLLAHFIPKHMLAPVLLARNSPSVLLCLRESTRMTRGWWRSIAGAFCAGFVFVFLLTSLGKVALSSLGILGGAFLHALLLQAAIVFFTVYVTVLGELLLGMVQSEQHTQE